MTARNKVIQDVKSSPTFRGTAFACEIPTSLKSGYAILKPVKPVLDGRQARA
jgi:hypothetical protein